VGIVRSGAGERMSAGVRHGDTIRLADIATFDEMNAAWDVWVDPGHLPGRATVEAKLAGPDYLVEIAVAAARL
jgi:enamine deaminase RidA (YjgF/YER057c/UK114 family)